MRRFVIIGQRASASPDFSLEDVAGTGGRIDVLLRCLRAALLVSHGVRRDTLVYLVLLGGVRAPKAIRIDGRDAEYLRPDERSLALLMKKVLTTAGDEPAFVVGRHGISVANGGLDTVLEDLGAMTPYVLEPAGNDVRGVALDTRDPVFFVGDHLGFDARSRARLQSIGAAPIGIGPMSIHAEDAVAIASNEVDRQASAREANIRR
jgi:tRNA (pseudouridine54-N1)-methyltransferase